MQRILDKCPVCAGKMMISELECMDCTTKVVSQFDITENGINIEPDFLDFIKIFIYAEGSIKQCEKLLNCSYPKIKNLLKKTKVALGIKKDFNKSKESIIDQLERGEISVDEALEGLGDLK